MAKFRSTTTTTTGSTIKSTGGDVLMANITNRHSAAIFVKFYDSPVATFQDTPIFTVQVGANAQVTLQRQGNENIFGTNNGLAVRVVTDNTDAGNTAAGTLPIIEIEYR